MDNANRTAEWVNELQEEEEPPSTVTTDEEDEHLEGPAEHDRQKGAGEHVGSPRAACSGSKEEPRPGPSEVLSDDAKSVGGKSRKSSISVSSTGSGKSIRLRKKLAEIQLQKLLETQEIERQEAKQMADLKHRKELISARMELAELEAEQEEEEYGSAMSEVDFPRLKRAKDRPADVQWLPTRSPPPKDHMQQIDVRNQRAFQEGLDHVPLRSSPQSEMGSIGSEVARCITDALQKHTVLPKPHLLTFSGDSKQFTRFMKNFEAAIETMVSDDRLKLNYLIQHCNGEAKASIEDCVVLEPTDGYQKAKKILKRRYGRPWQIAEDYLQLLTEGPQVKAGDYQGLAAIVTQMEKCALNLHEIGFHSEIESSDTIRKVVRRLPYGMRTQWAEKASQIARRGRVATFEDLVEYIQEREEVAASMYGRDLALQPSKQSPQPQGMHQRGARVSGERGATTLASTGREESSHLTAVSSQGMESARNATPRLECVSCQGSCRNLADCLTFSTLPLKERRAIVLGNRRCFNCLNAGHFASNCPMPSQCNHEGCTDRRHHKLLHTWFPTPDEARPSAQVGAVTSRRSANVSTGAFLGIMAVKLRGTNGQVVETCALLDNGSTQSFVDAELARSLGLKGEKVNYSITTMTAEKKEQQGSKVNVYVITHGCPEGHMIRDVWTASQLKLPRRNAATAEDINQFQHLRDIPLHELPAGPVQLLIGAGSDALTPLEIRPPQAPGQPYAERSLLGWVIRGPSGRHTQHGDVNFSSSLEDLDANLSRLWQTDFSENAMTTKEAMSVEDKQALTMMQESVKMVDGHYEVDLPWKNDDDLPDNRGQALVRLEHVRRRLLRDPEMHRMYDAQIRDYIDNGYAREVTNEEIKEDDQRIPRRTWYMPHHPVTSAKKPGKVRVVFDGAAKYRGTCINDHLLQGPDLNNSLTGVLIRFRRERVALMADVHAMFHQVQVPKKDHAALRFLYWRDGDLHTKPKTFCMTRHVFGLRSSPSCAVFALQQTAKDYGPAFSKETTASLKNMYVDDLLLSAPNHNEAQVVADEIHALLQCGGFSLEKWASNDRGLLERIPEERRAQSVRKLNLTGDALPCEHALGMVWDPNSDAFRFTTKIKDKPLTKRGILSSVSTLFDPLGLVAPIMLEPKLIIQELTKQKMSWDAPVSAASQEKWATWREKLPAIEEFDIPRLYGTPLGLSECKSQLHVFCDASENGYGACAYLRMEADDVTSCLVAGKSRLAPIKMTTIPRLELTAAMLASKVRAQLVEELDTPLEKIVMWSDSMIALGYIRNTTARFKTFVANKVTTIHDLSMASEWRYVPTKMNPADLASRGFPANDMASLHCWLSGPRFLLQKESSWPPEVKEPSLSEDDPEIKEVISAAVSDEDDVMLHFATRYSSLHKAMRSLAWWRRFLLCLKKKRSGPLTTEEVDMARNLLVQSAQQRHYHEDLKSLEEIGRVKATSHLASLDPCLKDGLICTGSRLRFRPNHSCMIIMPDKDPLTSLLVQEIHCSNGHVGSEQVLAVSRNRYWIVRGRAAVKRELSRCIICQRMKKPLMTQKMAPVLKEQVTADKPPFSYVGVDFFGPFHVKQRRGTVKRYGCLFTCLAMRAVHLEIAQSLTTDSFLAAVSRFVARRGIPLKMFSDNGTNLKAAEKELREGIRCLNAEVIHSAMLRRGIDWHFNPPHASHMGGLWERLIRSVRSILRAIVGLQLLSDEGLSTVMAEVERILNDRPLTTVSCDSRDAEVLTPATLLLMRRETSSAPFGVFRKDDCYARRWWRQAQYISVLFWRRWLKEYVPVLLQRQKWHRAKRNLAAGDVVLVADLNLPRGQWPLGVVKEVRVGRDGLIRSASVRTATSVLVRPVTQLCPLEGVEDAPLSTPAGLAP